MKKLSFWRFFKRFVVLCFIAFCGTPGFADNITTSPADCNSATLNTDTGPATLNAQWEANKITISWYKDGEKITNDANAATTCTYDQTFTVPSAPTKTGYNFTGWKVVNVPSGYTQLEYIQSTGTQYIDTGYTPNQNTEIVAKTMATTTGKYIYGVTSSGNTRSLTAYFSSSANWRFEAGAVTVASATAYTASTVHDSIQNKDGVWIDGTKIGSYNNIADFTAPYTLVLFGANGSTISKATGVRIYSLRINENGQTVMNLIPVKNSENIAGMLDTVSGQFFPNNGTETFTLGSPVNQ